ncbi:hypothetical protein KY49_204 [Burkholderia sp. MSHR3999]|nr:hypothetical protein KY49_204 [Burkholderia sp. MSHR3999]
MYASTFIFRAGQYDDEFHRLDRQIADIARDSGLSGGGDLGAR